MSENLREYAASAVSPVLAAEDEESDAFILRRTFERMAMSYPLVIVPDGREAVEYLNGDGPYANRLAHPLPCLLLLDLKMPRMNGFEVLAWLSQRPQFKSTPVIVLSSSCHDADAQKCRQMGAWDFYTKPMAFEKWADVIESVATRWLRNPRRLSSAGFGGVAQAAIGKTNRVY